MIITFIKLLNDHLESSGFSVLLGTKCLMSRPPEMAIHRVAVSPEFRSLNPEHSATDRLLMLGTV
jgi:hypothetical protein